MGMLLAADVGNSNTVFGLFDGSMLVQQWRTHTDHNRLGDEWGILLLALLDSAALSRTAVSHAVIGSVVPTVTPALSEGLVRHVRCEVLIATRHNVQGVAIEVEEPDSVGVDRLLNVLGALQHHQAPLIIVDFGTATTFDAVSPSGAFVGGAIAPGLGISADALFAATALLPRIALVAPEKAIGTNTVTNMQAGIVLGYADLTRGLVERMRCELSGTVTVIATGGLAETLAPVCGVFDVVDPALTLHGLLEVWLGHQVAISRRFSGNADQQH